MTQGSEIVCVIQEWLWSVGLDSIFIYWEVLISGRGDQEQRREQQGCHRFDRLGCKLQSRLEAKLLGLQPARDLNFPLQEMWLCLCEVKCKHSPMLKESGWSTTRWHGHFEYTHKGNLWKKNQHTHTDTFEAQHCDISSFWHFIIFTAWWVSQGKCTLD